MTTADPKDSARLDWLEQHSEHTGWLTVRYPSLRAAIDAAMNDEPKVVERLCPRCKTGKEEDPHTCPYADEMFPEGADADLCSCCESCMIQCAQDI